MTRLHTHLRDRQGISGWWNGLWFEPNTPGMLGFCRLLFFGLMLWFHWPLDFTVWGDLPPSFQNSNPILLFELLNTGTPTTKWLAIMQAAFKISLALACIGLLTRVSCWVALISGIYVLGMPHTFGKTGHGDGILVLAMLVLAISRCGDAWSIDALVRSWRKGPPFQGIASGEYTWPIRCIWLLTALIFLAAGIAKLRMNHTVTAWFWSDNLSVVLLQHKYKSNPPTDWGIWLSQFEMLCRFLALGIILVEVLFPLAIISRWARRILVPSMFIAQVGIWLTMGVFFLQFMFIYLFWVPWDRIGRFIQQSAATVMQRRFVFFDGGCGFCRKAVSVLWHLDVLGRTELLDVVNQWNTIESRFGQFDRAAGLEDMHAITPDGRVFKGHDAYRQMAWVLPATWVLLPLLYLPPVRWLGWKIYRHVADHRHDAGCEVPQSERGMAVSAMHSPPQRQAHGRDAHATVKST